MFQPTIAAMTMAAIPVAATISRHLPDALHARLAAPHRPLPDEPDPPP
jgi:hypothetical protein